MGTFLTLFHLVSGPEETSLRSALPNGYGLKVDGDVRDENLVGDRRSR